MCHGCRSIVEPRLVRIASMRRSTASGTVRPPACCSAPGSRRCAGVVRIVLVRRRTGIASSHGTAAARRCRGSPIDVHLLAEAVGVEQERPRPAGAAAGRRGGVEGQARSRRRARRRRTCRRYGEQRTDVALARVAPGSVFQGDCATPACSRSRTARGRRARTSAENPRQRRSARPDRARHARSAAGRRTCRPESDPSRCACW